MKNVTLVSVEPPLLLGPNGEKIEIFDRYIRKLKSKSKSRNTLISYATGVSQFLDYLIEAGCFLNLSATSIESLDTYIEAYPDFLIDSRYSSDEKISDIALRLGRLPITKSSCTPRIAAVNSLLQFNKAWRTQLQHLDKQRETEIPLRSDTFPRNIGYYENENIVRNSIILSNMDARLATRGKHTHPTAIAAPDKRGDVFFGKDFPLELVIPLCNRASSARDRCLFALLAAGGLRISEALAVQLSLIDINARQLRIPDPYNLHKSSSYPLELKLPWKGRETALVFMFEPIKTIFFKALEDYLAVRPTTEHDYLFVYHGQYKYGEPLYYGMTSSSLNGSLNDSFKESQKRIYKDYNNSKSTKLYSIHSLRHLYGVYLLNHVWLEGRAEPGLLLEEVQICMGHKEIKSTAKYAKKKAEQIIMKLEAADRIVFSANHEININHVIASNYENLAKIYRSKASEEIEKK